MKKQRILATLLSLFLLLSLIPATPAKAADTCIVTFMNYDRQSIYAQVPVAYGEKILPAPVIPDSPGYKFLGWYDTYGSKVNFDTKNIYSSMIVYAKVEITQYQVTFYNENNVLAGTCMVDHGKAATPPSTILTAYPVKKNGETFKSVLKWNQDFSCVTQNMIVTATRSLILLPGNKYKASNGYVYKATGANTVKLVKTSKGKNITSLSVPASVKLGGVNCKVTSIDAKVFKDCKKLTKVTIGSNVKSIGASAFAGCTNLKSVKISSKNITSIGSGAFKGIYGKASFKVPSSKKSKYKALLKKAGVTSKMSIK